MIIIILILFFLVILSGCTSQQIKSSQISPTAETRTPSITNKITFKPTVTKESYNPQYSRGDLILIKDPVDLEKCLIYKDLLEQVSGIDLDGKKLGRLIINTTWEDPTWPGQARYNYLLMYESSQGVWSRTALTQGAPATQIDKFANELIGRFPDMNIENTETIRIK